MTDRHHEIESFLAFAGWAAAERHPQAGDASTRRYTRLNLNGKTALLMDQPQGAESPAAAANATAAERRALGYNALARLAGADVGRFVAAANFLRDLDLSAPEIYAADVPHGLLLIEDFGTAQFADVLTNDPRGETARTLYETAAEALARIHADAAPKELGGGKPLYAYDDIALEAETDLLTEWFFPVGLGRAATEEETAEHRALWRTVLSACRPARPVFVHRDYHAQNLLWLPRRTGAARAGLIDFQDAVAGSPAYDLISLTEDARRDVSEDLARATTERYLAAMAAQNLAPDAESFATEMAVYAAQRNAKIVGIFARLYKRDGKAQYLRYLPRVWTYLTRDLRHPALRELETWYDRKISHRARSATTAA